jgi:phage antirepressor [staphylococcus prophage phiPV83]
VVRWNRVRKYLTELGCSDCQKNDFIPENIFYRLAMKAKNSIAEKFQAKVADEIIPTIRKTGGYVANDELFINTYLPYADEQTKLLFKSNLTTIRNLNSQIARMKPKELFADSVSSSKDCILIGTLAKLIRQNGYDIGQNRLFQWMRDNNYLISRKGNDYNIPTQYSMELGLFKIKENVTRTIYGTEKLTRTVYVTGKGQQYFINKFLNKQCVS